MLPLVEHPTGKLLATVVGLRMQCICHCGSVRRRQAPPRAGAMTFTSFASGTPALCHHLCACHQASPCYSSTLVCRSAMYARSIKLRGQPWSDNELSTQCATPVPGTHTNVLIALHFQTRHSVVLGRFDLCQSFRLTSLLANTSRRLFDTPYYSIRQKLNSDATFDFAPPSSPCRDIWRHPATRRSESHPQHRTSYSITSFTLHIPSALRRDNAHDDCHPSTRVFREQPHTASTHDLRP